MTEEIITDGVDVAGCKHYKTETCLADYLFTDMAFSEAKCVLSPNCYYKQLKRLEQENKELKEFKKEVLKPVFLPNIEEKVTNTYRSALEEIRDLAKDAKEYKYSTKSEDYSEGMYTIGCYILDKINEVLNESK